MKFGAWCRWKPMCKHCKMVAKYVKIIEWIRCFWCPEIRLKYIESCRLSRTLALDWEMARKSVFGSVCSNGHIKHSWLMNGQLAFDKALKWINNSSVVLLHIQISLLEDFHVQAYSFYQCLSLQFWSLVLRWIQQLRTALLSIQW